MMNSFYAKHISKALSLVLLLTGIVSQSSAQMYFRETFEAQFTPNTVLGPNAPVGWAQTRQGTTIASPTGSTTSGSKDWAWMNWTGSVWGSNTLPNVNYAGNGTVPDNPFQGSGAVWFNDAYTSTPGQNLRRLESPVIDLSAATNPVIKLTYWYVSGGATSKVQGSVNGTTWTDLQTLTTTGANWVTYTITVPAGMRTATFQVGIQAINAFQSQGIWLDDVSVFDYPASFTSTASGGDWSNPATWAGGVAPVLSKGTEAVIIAPGANVTMDVASTVGSVTVSTGATLSLKNNLVNNGALTINSGGLLNAYTGALGSTVTVSGSFTNAGTADMSKQGSVLILNGTAVQDISGTFVNNTIPVLTINNTAGVTLSTAIKVPVALNLTRGALGGTGLLTLGDAAFSTGFTMTSTGGSVTCPVVSGLSGVETVAYTYNPAVPAGTYTTGNELSVTAPNLNITFTAMTGGNYILGSDVIANTVVLNDTVTVNGVNSFTVNGVATFTATTVVNGAGMFSMGGNATLSTNNIAGITAFSAAGSVQTATRNYSNTGNYIYGGAAGQVTGDGLPLALMGGTVTANNNALTLTQTTTFNHLTLNVNLITAPGTDVSINGTGNLGTLAITGGGSFTAGADSRLLLGSTHANGVIQTSANGNIQVTGLKTFTTGVDISIGGSAVATGNAFPVSGIDTLILNHTTAAGVALTAATSANTLLITNTGRLITTAANRLAVLGTAAGNVSRSSTGYIDGPFSRTIPASASGSYLFPVGRSTTAAAHAMELLNPVVTGATVTLTAEVLNASAAGTAGTGITALNTNRYWKVWPAGAGSTLSANVKIYESVMNAANKVAYATGATPAATYNSVGGLVHNNISITGFSPVSFATPADTAFFVLGIGSSSGTFAAGTYPVGPSGTYKSIGEALANINNNAAMGGAVVLELQPAYTPAVETYPVAFPQTLPTSAVNTITIRPASAVTSVISFTGSTSGANVPLFDMNGAKNIVIDGRPGGAGTNQYISIAQTDNNPAIRFINDAQNIVLRRVALAANVTSATSGVVFFSTAGGALAANGNSTDTLDLCSINGNSIAANAVYASGSSSPADNKSCVVMNCAIYDFFTNGGTAAGINITSGNTAWTISGNTIYQTAARTTTSTPALTTTLTARGIYIANTSGNAFTVTGNTIGGNIPGVPAAVFVFGDNTISSAAHAIRAIELSVGNTTASSVQGNTIAGISVYSTTSSDPFTGIYASAGWVNTGDATANTIGSGTATGSVLITQIGSSTATGYGIRYATAGGNIQNNIIGAVTADITRTTSTGSLLFHGINASGTHTLPLAVTNNIIGSTGTPNSIYGTAAAVSGIGFIGINLNGATGRAVTVTGNTIANITNDNTTASANAYVLGIWATGASSVSTTITSNTIRNLSNAARNTAATQNAALVGIATNTSGAGPQVISGNTIHSLVADNTAAVTASVNTAGIYYSSTNTNAAGNRIDRNLVHSFKSGGLNTAVSQQGVTIAGGTTRVAVTNNMIRLGIDAAGADVTDTASITGIYKTGGVLSAFFNSVYIGGAGVNSGTTATYAFRRAGSGTDSLLNNIFVNARSGSTPNGSHYAIGLANATALTLNYNGYYANGTGGALGQFNGLTQPGMAAWQVAGGQDMYSFNADPSFISPAGTAATVNLHISPAVPTPVEGTGLFIASVSTDMDGNDRSLLTPVDIGAHAGNFIPKDVVPPIITYTPMDIAPSSALTRTLTATISDASGVLITGAPQVYFKKMAAGGYASAPGSLVSGNALNGVWSFTIDHSLVGGIAAGDSVYYFVVAQDTALSANIGSSPPGAEGANTSALSAYPPLVNSYPVRAGIHGTLPVGASQAAPGYTNLTAAIADIQTRILDGDITLLLQPDYTSVTESFPILLPAFNTDSIGRTITIKPDAGVTPVITSSAISVIKIIGGDYYTIDGSNSGTNSRDLTLYNAGAVANSSVVWLASASGTDGATHNTIKNCIISGRDKVTTEVAVFAGGPTGAGAGSFNALTPNSHNLIQNNLVMKAKYGLWFKGVSAAILDSNNRVDRNDFGTANAGDGFNEGIFVFQLQKNALITKNNLRGLSGSGVGTADIAGSSTIVPVLYLRQSINSTLNGNKVFNINYAGSSRVHSIFVEAPAFNTVTNPSNNVVVNNAVYDVRLSGSAGWLSGINANGGYGDRFYFNSVYLSGILNTASTTAVGFSNGNSSSTAATSAVEVKNNIFYVSSSATSGTCYAHYTPNATSYTGSIVNYNLLRSLAGGGATAYTGYNGTNRATLTDWQTGTAQETNSIGSDPAFASTTNLTPGLGSPVIAAGIAAGGILSDINDSVRSTPPSIGAYDKANDFAPPSIVYTPVSNTQSTASRVFSNLAVITDPSGVDMTPGNQPRIYYKKKSEANMFGSYPTDNNSTFNGWKYQEASNAASPYSFGIDYSLLTGAVVTGDVIQYFVTAQDASVSRNVGANPSKGFTAASVSAVTAAPDTPSFYYIVGAPMSGAYTVGTSSASPDYTTLTDAVKDVELRGVNGPVTLELTDALYTTPAETFPIVINPAPGASPANTITIKPFAGVSPVITGISLSAIIRLSGAKYVTIDGSNTAGGTSKDLSITNTNILANTAAVWIASTSATSGCLSDTIKNCIIETGTNTIATYGIFAGGATIAVASGDSNNYIGIVNNTISKAQTGIYIGAASANEGLYIAGNSIGSVLPGSQIGQNLLTLIKTNNAVVTGNDMFGITQTAAVDGVLIGAGVTNLVFKKNTIHHLVNTNVNKLWAVTVSSGAAANNTFSNNSIHSIMSNATGTLASRICAGFAVTSGNGYRFYHNSVSLTGDRDTAGTTKPTVPSACMYLASGLTSAVDIRNNIFSNTQVAATNAARSYTIYCASPNTIFSSINYNNYYVSGAQGMLAYLNADVATLPALRMATASDTYSVNVNPVFASATDLSVASGSAPNPMESGAVVIAGISTDINGNPRPNQVPTSYGGNLAPDMGAYEFDGATLDVIPPVITFSPLGNGVSLISRTLTAAITDTGATATGIEISTGLAPRIYFRKKSDGNMFSPSNLSSDSGWKWVESATGSSPFTFTIDYSLVLGGSVSNYDTVVYFVAAQDLAAVPNLSANPATGFAGTSVAAVSTAPAVPYQYIIVTAPPMAGVYRVGSAGGASYATITSAITDLSLRGVSAPVTFELTDASYGAPAESFPVVLPAYTGSNATNTVTIKPAAGVNATITGSAGAPAVIKLLNAANYILDGIAGGSSLTVTATNTSASAAIWMASTVSAGPGCNHISLKNMQISGGSNTTGNYGIIAGADGAAPSTTAGMDNDDILIQGNTILRCYYAIYANGTSAASAGGLDNWRINNNIIGPDAGGSDNIGFAGIWMANALNATISGDTIRNLLTTAGSSGAVYLSSNISRAVVSGNVIRDIYSTGPGSGNASITGIYVGSNVTGSMISGNTIKGVANKSTVGYGAKGLIVNTSNASSNDTIVNNFVSDVYCYVDINSIYWPVGIDIQGTSGSIRVYYNSVHLFDDHTGLSTGATASAALFVNATGGNLDIRNNILVNSYHNSLSSTDRSYALYSMSAGTVFADINYNNYYVSGPAGILAYLSSDQPTLANLRTATGKDLNSANVNVAFAGPADLHLTAPSVGDYNLKGISIGGITTDIDGDVRYTIPYMGADENTANPLPVTLLSFTAAAKQATVAVSWTTASETNSSFFEVERSIAGKPGTWNSAGKVMAAGNSSTARNYRLTDDVSELINKTATIYYRLKMTDRDGSFVYSQTVPVQLQTITGNHSFSVFPNPFSSELFVQLNTSTASRAKVTVTDMTGKVMASDWYETIKGTNTIDLSDVQLKAGMYFLSVEEEGTQGGKHEVLKVIRQ